MRRIDGSISIFLVMIVPLFVLGLITGFLYLKEMHEDNQVIQTALNASDIQLDLSNEHLFENYGIMAYTDQSLVLDMISGEFGESVQVKVNHKNLSNPYNFMESIQKAGYALSGNILMDKIYEILNQSYDLNLATELMSAVEEAEKALRLINDFSEIQKTFSRMKEDGFTTNALLDAAVLIKSKYKDNEKYFKQLNEDFDINKSNSMELVYRQLDQAFNETNNILERVLQKTDRIIVLKSDLKEQRAHLSDLRNDLSFLEGAEEIDPDLVSQKKLEIEYVKSVIRELNTQIQLQLKSILSDLDNESPGILNNVLNLVNQLGQIDLILDSLKEKHLNDPDKDWIGTVDDIELNKIYTVEYLLSVFKSLDKGTPRNFDPLGNKDTRSSVLENEVGFLILGHKSDRQNTLGLRGRIFSIRAMANLIHIIKDSQKMNEINLVTASLPHPWNVMTKTSLMTLWSGVEAYVDLNALENGEGFHLIKTSTEWKIDIENLMIGKWAGSIDLQSNGIYDPKIYYQDYIRFLMLSTPHEDLINRAMILMDENMMKASSNRFGLEDFNTGHRIELKWRSNAYEFESNY